MLPTDTREEIAAEIIRCLREKAQIPLLTTTYPDIDVADSYHIQEAVIKAFTDEGQRVRGYKIGLTSKPMQEMLGSSEPDYSSMLDSMFIPESSELLHSDFLQPMAEIEIAFVMKDELRGPGVNIADVIRATDFVLPAIEIVDFRVAPGPGMAITDTIADLAAVGAVVLGGNPMKLTDIDVRAIGGTLEINGETKEQGTSAAVLGNPVTAIAWLANKLAEFDITFKPGDVILSGSFLRAVPINAGDEVVARFDNGFGDVSLSFK